MKKLFSTLIALLMVYAVSAQCTAAFTWSFDPNNPQTVDLVNTSTYTPIPGSTPNYYVHWGDGSTSQYLFSPNASHNYTNPGTYQIDLVMFYVDSLNNFTTYCFDSTYQLVTILPSPCVSTISTTNNGGGNYTFTANNSNTGITYAWDFGDGSTGTGSPVTHSYTNSGTYQVTLVSSGLGCTYTSTTSVSYFNGSLNCSQYNAGFSTTGSGYTFNFNNTSTWAFVPGAMITTSSSWTFGDGGTSTAYSPSHTYASAGTYTVTLTHQWIDSSNQNVLCTDTYTSTVTATTPPPPPNVITGQVIWDSLNPSVSNASFRVWLIVHDSSANTLTAIDSLVISGFTATTYAFNNHPMGVYYTKAALLNGSPTTLNLIPTYHDSSVYWNNASQIFHSGGTTSGKHIYMQTGTPVPGPGFIGGNISAGANKGTGAGVPNLLVMLRDDNGNVVRFTYTDANGDYTFGGISSGMYDVYPEAMNYATTPAPVSLIVPNIVENAINFKQTPTEIKPISQGISTTPETKQFSIYPNPARDVVNITSSVNGSSTVMIMDLAGRTVASTTLNASGNTSMNISQLNSGVYFIRIASENGQHTEKLILQR
jgi:PKD repeat protein